MSEQPTTEFGRSPEKIREPRQLSVEIPQNSPPELKRDQEKANLYLKGLSILQQWSQRDFDLDREYETRKDLLSISRLSGLLQTLRSLEDPETPSENKRFLEKTLPRDLENSFPQETFSSETQKISEKLTDLIDQKRKSILGNEWKEPKTSFIQINNQSEMTQFWQRVTNADHDSRSPITQVIGNLEFKEIGLEIDKKAVAEGFARAAPLLEAAYSTIAEHFSQEPMSAKTILGKIEDMSQTIPPEVTTEINEEYARGLGMVLLSDDILSKLIYNVGQNAKRSYDAKEQITAEKTEYKPLRITLNKTSQANKNYLDLIFEDDGIGFPRDILEYGFQHGTTTWGESKVAGTGVGMAGLSKLIKEHYQGKVIPENKVESGKVLGARLTIRLPLQEPQK